MATRATERTPGVADGTYLHSDNGDHPPKGDGRTSGARRPSGAGPLLNFGWGFSPLSPYMYFPGYTRGEEVEL